MPATDLVTGAFSYTGSHIAQRLLDSGRGVRTLTFHRDRPHALRADIDTRRYRFDDPVALTESLRGVHTLYNTFWVRFDHGSASFAAAIEHSRMLFFAARNAGVRRIVHVSITNASVDSPLPYFCGKARVEYALAQSGVPYAVVRPTWVFGGERDVLANNIAWILRRMPAFALPGDGRYPVQPVHVDDLARICVQAGATAGDLVLDAAGPETYAFGDLVALVRDAVDTRSPVLHLPVPVMAAASRALGLLMHDVVLTPDEIRGLMAGLLVSPDPPLGTIAFSDWLSEHRESVGRAYANELDRHFAAPAAA